MKSIGLRATGTNIQIVAVGDATKVRESLAKYGAVESFNAEGKPLSNN